MTSDQGFFTSFYCVDGDQTGYFGNMLAEHVLKPADHPQSVSLYGMSWAGKSWLCERMLSPVIGSQDASNLCAGGSRTNVVKVEDKVYRHTDLGCEWFRDEPYTCQVKRKIFTPRAPEGRLGADFIEHADLSNLLRADVVITMASVISPYSGQEYFDGIVSMLYRETRDGPGVIMRFLQITNKLLTIVPTKRRAALRTEWDNAKVLFVRRTIVPQLQQTQSYAKKLHFTSTFVKGIRQNIIGLYKAYNNDCRSVYAQSNQSFRKSVSNRKMPDGIVKFGTCS